MTEYHITGQIVDRSRRSRAAGLRVEAWDKDRREDDDVLGTALTDETGAFAIQFDESYRDTPFEREPDLYFRIFKDGERLVSVQDEIANEKGGSYRVTLTVNAVERTAALFEPIEVNSYGELLQREAEIVERINSFPNGGNLFMTHPLRLLEDVGVRLSEGAVRELLKVEPRLSSLSDVPYNALKLSEARQNVRFRLHGLFERR